MDLENLPETREMIAYIFLMLKRFEPLIKEYEQAAQWKKRRLLKGAK